MHKTENPPAERGRAPLKPTKQQRSDVTLLVAGGLSEEQIAADLGICRNTLRKHFAEELSNGAALEQARNLRRLREAADGGNVTAMKHLTAVFAGPTAGVAPGKKAEAQRAAETAGDGTEWGEDLKAPDHRPN